MVTFNNFGDRYQPSVHYGRENVNARMRQRAAMKAAQHVAEHSSSGQEVTNIKINLGPSKSQVIGGVVGTGIKVLLSALGVGDSSNVSQVQNTYVPTSSSPVSNSSNVSNSDNVTNTTSTTVQPDTAPNASDIDTSALPAGSSISSVSQGSVDGSPSYVATVQNSDGTTGTYALTKNSSGKYKIGAQLSKTRGNNYVNQDKLNSALEKEFGKGFELPEGYTAELVGDTPVIKDANGKKLNSTELTLLKTNGEISEKAAQTSDSDDVNKMLDEADQNGDKALNQDEYKEYITGLLDASGIDTNGDLKAQIDSLIDESFQSIDKKNADGLLSKEELNENASSVLNELTEKIGKLVGLQIEGDADNGKI